MPQYQPAFLSSWLSKSALRSLASIYLVRIYVGTALVLPALATSAIATPHRHQELGKAAQPSDLTSLANTSGSAVLITSNPRIGRLTQAIEQHPNNAALYNSRGWYSFLDGNYTQAANDYSRVIELGIETIDPVYHTSVYHVRGLAYAELGETALAIASLQVAAEMYGAQNNAAGVQEVEAHIAQLSE